MKCVLENDLNKGWRYNDFVFVSASIFDISKSHG